MLHFFTVAEFQIIPVSSNGWVPALIMQKHLLQQHLEELYGHKCLHELSIGDCMN